MVAEFRIGTSGWVYPHWRDLFYPTGLPQRAWLTFFANHFDTVEVNYSFYRLPSPASFARWHAMTPPNFLFAMKGSRFITHVKRLRDTETPVRTFLERAELLGQKLGPILWQLPPDFPRDDGRLAAFLDVLPPGRRYAFEFRDPSWFSDPIYALLSRFGAALCLANRDGRDQPSTPILTADWTYLRFHGGLAGGDYLDDQLRHWAGVIADWRGHGVSAFAYFNNDFHGFAVKNAARLREMFAEG